MEATTFQGLRHAMKDIKLPSPQKRASANPVNWPAPHNGGSLISVVEKEPGLEAIRNDVWP
ncbi:hypothetical protein RE428_16370 [Marinobacter nanhaiticus D15-8W]|nr:hypothetical protein RE428_16370 [Marinobacter nanhaiticus D15-8W]